MKRLLLCLLLLCQPVFGAIDCDKVQALDLASAGTSTIPAKSNNYETIKVCAVGLTGTTATVSNAVQGTTVTIASNSVTKATYVIGTSPLGLGTGTGMLFQGEPGQSIVVTCGTGSCKGSITYQ